MTREAAPLAPERAARLYQTWGPVVYRRCARLVADRAAARDATREVFVVLMREPGKLEGDPLEALAQIYRVATRCCLERLGRDPAGECEAVERMVDELAGASGRPAGKDGR